MDWLGERDHAEKELEMYEDVFADIVNVLLFNGEEIIEPENLSDAEPRPQYSGDGEDAVGCPERPQIYGSLLCFK